MGHSVSGVKRRCTRSSPVLGMTLVELMVSLAISGVVLLGAASFMTQTTKLAAVGGNQATATEEMTLFSYALQQHISNATQVFCNCKGPASSASQDKSACTFGTAFVVDTTDACDEGRQAGTACVNGGETAPAVDNWIVAAAFVVETAANPLEYPTGAGCLTESSPAYYGTATGGLTKVHGCKKFMQLVYRRATKQNGTAGSEASQPGVLRLVDATSSFAGYASYASSPYTTSPASTKTIVELANVAAFRCGLSLEDGTTATADGRASMKDFEVFAYLKILNRNVGTTTANNAPGVSSYFPSDANFDSGNALIRRLSGKYSLRNINYRGRIFGPAQTQACAAVGQPASSDSVCCTHSRDAGGLCGGKCIAPGNLASGIYSCCSGQSDIGGRCI